ncbi:hypothetical protein KL932_004855 [Ogataea haglerorum]|nr:hypothetical protein KL914_002981 [Ogataea haglerorum]KAG7734401.1 hypothetical protein KL932_004855 [Ogataea haglerorum]KAG7758830.1 hypothetical protein KL947_002499 [Ogataea haglerorum]KAG7810263.1 hypothetical protein KL924_002531 [Ogataea haglerorum]
MDAKQNDKEVSLYLGNLDPKVDETLLYELFVQFAPVKSIRLPKDKVLRTHQGYGFVEFFNVKDCEYVLNICSGLSLYDKVLRVKKLIGGQADAPEIDEDIGPVVYVGNLDKLVDSGSISSTFANFGTFRKPPQVVPGEKSNHAFIYYTDFESSDEAIKEMNGKIIMNRPIKMDYAYKKDSKEKHGDRTERLLYEKARENNFELEQLKKR